jgi:hypothetical protein
MLTVVATLTLGFLLGRVWEIRKALRRQLSEAQHSMTTRNPDDPATPRDLLRGSHLARPD